jgi:hypothetical protein
MSINGQTIRQTLLEVCNDAAARAERGSGQFQSLTVLRETARRLGVGSLDQEQALLTAWADLFRLGVLAWGYNLNNPDPPFVHLTDAGRRTLSNLSRDPYNPAGYLATVAPHLSGAPVARSYLEEGLDTFQAGCLKATAVMIGAAAEALVLDVRDALIARFGVIGASVPASLQDWRVKTVRDAIEIEIETRRAQLDRRLYERFSAYWVAVSDQMRLARNDAGHPQSVDPVTHDTVHAGLLLFPEFASLVKDVIAWISASLA